MICAGDVLALTAVLAHPVRSAVLLFLAVVACGVEQLHFENTTLTFHPLVTDTEVVALFPFTSAAAGPVTIGDVAATCGCTTTRLEKRTYAPEEKGAIGVTFSVGDRTGIQNKTIKVSILGVEGTITLTLVVHLPEGPIFSRRFIDWNVDDAPGEKSVLITIPEGSAYEVRGVETKDPRIEVACVAGVDPRRQRVNIRVSDTTKPFSGTVQVISNFRTFPLFVRVVAAKRP
jgi:hypothetical protein